MEVKTSLLVEKKFLAPLKRIREVDQGLSLGLKTLDLFQKQSYSFLHIELLSRLLSR